MIKILLSVLIAMILTIFAYYSLPDPDTKQAIGAIVWGGLLALFIYYLIEILEQSRFLREGLKKE